MLFSIGLVLLLCTCRVDDGAELGGKKFQQKGVSADAVF
jgi:hypothetical protein